MRWLQQLSVWSSTKPKIYTIEDLSSAAGSSEEQSQLVGCLLQGHTNPSISLNINELLTGVYSNQTALTHAMNCSNYANATLLLEAGADLFTIEEKRFETHIDTPMSQALFKLTCTPMIAAFLLYYDREMRIKQKIYGKSLYTSISRTPQEKTLVDTFIEKYQRLHQQQEQGGKYFKQATLAIKQGELLTADDLYIQAADAFLNAAKIMIDEIPQFITEHIENKLLKGRTEHIWKNHRRAKYQLAPWFHYITFTLLQQAKAAIDRVDSQGLQEESDALFAKYTAQKEVIEKIYQRYKAEREQNSRYQQYAEHIETIRKHFHTTEEKLSLEAFDTRFFPSPAAIPMQIIKEAKGDLPLSKNLRKRRPLT